jgi:ribosomal protein L29
MRFKELEGKTEKELQALIGEGRARLHMLKLGRVTNQLKDVREIREIRKDIARMMTKIGTLTTK